MKNADEVAVFWDYENCPAPTNTSGYVIVNNIRSVAQNFGSVKLFKAYLEVTEQVPVSRALALRSELQSSGVSLTDCPHNGRKDVADKMILVDMLAYAIDNPAPSTIVLISGDRDFAYALSILRLRRYRVVLITLSNAHPSLRAQASLCFDWISDVLEPVDPSHPTFSHQPTSPRRGKTSATPAHERFYSGQTDTSRDPFQGSYNERSTSNVEFMDYLQDETRRRESSRMHLKHDAGHDLLPRELEQSKRQLAASSMASSALRNGPECPARVIYSPVTSSYPTYLNGTGIEMTARGSNSSQTTLTPSTCVGSTPTPAAYESIMASIFPAHSTLQSSPRLPNLVQPKVDSVTEPVSFEYTTRIFPVESVLRRSSPSSQQQGTYSLVNVRTQSPSSINPMDDDDNGDLDSPPAHSDIPPNVTTSPLSASAPSFMPPSSLSHATTSAIAQSSVEAANPPQPTSFPTVPDKFKILVQCLTSHRSKGRFHPLRSQIALGIAHNGATYRQAGVSKFSEYVAIAEKAGIVALGGTGGAAWIAIKEPWYNVPLS